MNYIWIFIVIMVVVNGISKVSKQQKANSKNSKEQSDSQPRTERDISTRTTNQNTKKDINLVEYSKFDAGRVQMGDDTKLLKKALRHDGGNKNRTNMKVVRCPYCGAENEVSNSGTENYKCYFCWSRL